MELDLDLSPRTSGRASADLAADYVRDLTPADMEALALPRGISAPSLLKRLTDRHHALAQALASGLTKAEAASLTGYDPSRVSILQADPAFQELLSHYRETKAEHFVDVQRRLASLNIVAIDTLADRIEDDPDAIATDSLVDIVKMSADRTGHGPQTKSTNVNITVDMAGRLEAARRRMDALATTRTIDAQPSIPDHSTTDSDGE
jgi:hypothetical protein